jgi:clan AA aspartic protease
MGTFRQSLEIGDFTGQRFEPVDALVDTGATYTTVPRDVLQRLGVQADEQRNFVLADGRRVQMDMGWARVRLDNREQPSIVLFAEPGTRPLLGAFTLEGFGLTVDPVNKRLVPAEGYLVGIRGSGTD